MDSITVAGTKYVMKITTGLLYNKLEDKRKKSFKH